MKSSLPDNPKVKDTIQRTLMTSVLFEGFWDRWIAHGIDKKIVSEYRRRLKSVETWIEVFKKSAEDYEMQARSYQEHNLFSEAEHAFRIAGLHYNLIQWLFPETGNEKRTWFEMCAALTKRADSLSNDRIMEAVIEIYGTYCFGRVRVPERPKGCVVIINPIDSSKEELFTYEMDFAKMGFVTVSFDGPGQGQTYVFNQYKATSQRWDLFVNQVIDFAAEQYPELNIYLFGTSSGGAWVIHGSRHLKVSKAASISPAFESDVKMPDYFKERMACILDDDENSLLPEFQNFERYSPILIFHGNKDVMVKNADIYGLYNKLSQGKQLIEYENEGHCCNNKLSEIRKEAAEWYLED